LINTLTRQYFTVFLNGNVPKTDDIFKTHSISEAISNTNEVKIYQRSRSINNAEYKYSNENNLARIKVVFIIFLKSIVLARVFPITLTDV
jgi:uncharacterized membrane protein